MATVTTLSREELLARREAAEWAEANLRLEGLTLTEEDATLMTRWAEGEFSDEEWLEALKALNTPRD